MTEVKINTHYTKEGQCFNIRFQCTSIDDAIELTQKVQEVFYDEGYHTTEVNIQEVDV